MDTKDKIIRASLNIFLNLGYEKTSLTMIAHEVGIKKPSIYYHFKGKEELFQKTVELLIDTIEMKVTDSANSYERSKERLNSIFNTLIKINNDLTPLLDEESNFNLYNFLHHELRQFPGLTERRNEYYKTLKKLIMDIIETGQIDHEMRRDINKELMALEIIAWIEGLFMLNSIYTAFSVNALRQDFFYNLWRILSAESTGKKSIFGRNSSKTISIGTKW